MGLEEHDVTDETNLECEAERIAAAIRARGGWVAEYELRVLPDEAAKILGYSEGHLRNLRSRLEGPAFDQVRDRGRVTYLIVVLLRYRIRRAA